MKVEYKCEKCEKAFTTEQECEAHEETCGNDDFVYVAECFVATQTYYENPRDFTMHKSTVKVCDAFVKLFKGLDGCSLDDQSHIQEIDNVMCNGFVIDSLDKKFVSLLYDDMLRGESFNKKTVSQILDSYEFMLFYEDDYNENEDLVAEIHFKSRLKRSDEIGIGYISVFRMHKDDFDKCEDIDVTAEKYVTGNRYRKY